MATTFEPVATPRTIVLTILLSVLTPPLFPRSDQSNQPDAPAAAIESTLDANPDIDPEPAGSTLLNSR